MGSIVCKWYNFGANWFGWVEMGPKKDQIGPKYPKQFKIGQKRSKKTKNGEILFKRLKIVQTS